MAAAKHTAAGGGDTTDDEARDDVLVEENQMNCIPLPSLMNPSSMVGMSLSMEMPRKRKGSVDNQETRLTPILNADMEEDQNDTDGEDQHAKMKCFREPHSQIEKRRRDKMNTLIDKLSDLIPTCNPMSRKLDKLTVLRMAVQHLKSLRGSASSFSDTNYKPSFLPDEELQHLILKAADGFLFVVGCDRGKIVFVSESITKILNYSRVELIGQSFFDYVHPKDIGKVKEQLSASELYPRERLIDAKTGLQVQADLPVGAARLCSGARRSFFCRMKCNKNLKVEEKELQASTSKKKESQKYCTVHCTGYMRSWHSSQLEAEGQCDADKQDSSHFSCLVAVGRIHSNSSPQVNGAFRVKPTEFVTRYTMDGKFTFVDQRATTILGYLPQELLGTSCYEYFHQDDLAHLADRHRKVLRSKEKIDTNRYKFKTKYGSFVTLQSQWFSFVNPWTKEVEYIVSTNTVISNDHSRTSRSGNKTEESSQAVAEDGKKSLPIIPGISTKPGTMIYAGTIGTQIANELLDFNRMNSSPSSGNVSPFSLPLDKSPLTTTHHQVNNNVPNGDVTEEEMPEKSNSEDELQEALIPGRETLMEDSSQLDLDSMVEPGLGSLSNDEAAMAVIMRLLETDSNLGEGEDFEEMHWSL
ncbi:aryl hydrocarbon receptor nuclear translocator-like protein 2 isoform X1 [Syngnathus scovelli]|uniref:aryl hydrocarbon receptor nuclear translocator-like protein 2 isoform X1 n=2 Tax=Syngnathus scovelli TaxID=161590 RepID=UPI002110A826|nr:aryl hydrocarbon receptor nuclear translocator-like protein 2 isoform X1 [Syngnathus scovelli]